MAGTKVNTAAGPKRFPTSAMAPKTTKPITAPSTELATFHPATDERTDVGNSSFTKAPPAGAKIAPPAVPMTYPATSADVPPL